jgi:O-antigen biosynthesis protein
MSRAMFSRFNPLNHPILFAPPERLTPFSAWHEHIPFAMLLVDLIRPRTIVELGTHAGDSYCAFCQAVNALDLDTRCSAIDTWSGHELGTTYGPEILSDLRAHHDPLYGRFSTLIQSNFDSTLGRFPDGSIDLLHIDGCHTYDAVKHDFESWLPKVSERGVVLFHDTTVTEVNFGVKAFWAEVRTQYPSFEFLHGNGLGILAVGAERPVALDEMLDSPAAEEASLRGLFSLLGGQFSAQVEVGRLNRRLADIHHSLGWRALRRLERINVRLLPEA